MGHPQAVGGGWILALLLLPETSSIPGTSSQPTGTRVSLSHPYTVQPSPQVQQAAQGRHRMLFLSHFCSCSPHTPPSVQMVPLSSTDVKQL